MGYLKWNRGQKKWDGGSTRETFFQKISTLSISIYFMHVQYIFFLKTSTHKTHQFTPFQIINFSFLKIPSCVTSLTIDRFGFVIFFSCRVYIRKSVPIEFSIKKDLNEKKQRNY